MSLSFKNKELYSEKIENQQSEWACIRHLKHLVVYFIVHIIYAKLVFLTKGSFLHF